MRYITDNATRMEHLIRDLLEFSRLEADGAEHFTRTSCDAAFEDALFNLQARIEECPVLRRSGAMRCRLFTATAPS